ncbi:MAG: hypothetical protein ACRC67_09080 [Inquilinus sp.]
MHQPQVAPAAGVLREPFAPFLALVMIAKTDRYAVLAVLTIGWW